ncbi:uncharacterized protein (DUF169 family) [Methanohalophilus levihalophilus]|uniref:DUF169 domain-containing protein n=1 Tax=Methanohalophilus levihalophilus TaxID=1431282 RepID=UPI001AE163F7|nr:DUF169 domain-containing protein [Methanohalophilus levihalophilus]MBP2031259.1 uncharacterized protein (DUF169 family) [Methanohalophilus levihalophilus]
MKYAEMTKSFRQFFELPLTPVAVKFNSDETPNISSPMRYCEMVRKSAALGTTFTATVDEMSCASAEVSLGFTEPSYGEVYPRVKPADTKQITVSPLDKTEFEPDAVVVVGSSAKLMRIAATLAKVEGGMIASKFKGEFAVCGECTAIPVMENKTNLSMLCSGARMFSDYRSDELAFGFPLDSFVHLVESLKEDSITKALCGCLMDDLPARVVDSILSLGFTKGTDHFIGRFGDEIIRLYIPKDERGKSSTVTLHVPVKFKDNDAAEAAEEVASTLFEDLMMYRRRENWIDVVLLVELYESINRAAAKPEKFTAFVNDGIEVMLEKISKFKRKAIK